MSVHVGREADFAEGDRRLVVSGDTQIGVFRLSDGFVAYENKCVHQGGPVCQGQYFPKMEAVLDAEGRVLGERANPGIAHLVCPWHSWEYDIRTGRMAADPRIRLRRFEVVCRDGEVYVVA
ncbi:Rieske (2Fe-2S) protein [Pseudonocardia acaciae]|uniref:Rieske (2Fe-2S) protein n=1 Tax=Pseudonocardia acaciae TaxID=551276 RepID=UPI00048AE1DF|nr:Rieske 2Fe-2S domain-containing protein [Pseudonocardia acaciae]